MLLQLSPEIEARVLEQARAQGVAAESYVSRLVEDAVRTAPAVAPRRDRKMNLKTLFCVMAAHSESVPALPDEAFTRESYYQDHD